MLINNVGEQRETLATASLNDTSNQQRIYQPLRFVGPDYLIQCPSIAARRNVPIGNASFLDDPCNLLKVPQLFSSQSG
ncbi:uncharacterized protein METZ01_LOCUS57548 [marine metagenome]|uniref:Uncharacterized protein n=1 Tax=marine metagenome TaxID=408172 RepID=A0A381SMQ2_9ZZZZ